MLTIILQIVLLRNKVSSALQSLKEHRPLGTLVTPSKYNGDR